MLIGLSLAQPAMRAIREGLDASAANSLEDLMTGAIGRADSGTCQLSLCTDSCISSRFAGLHRAQLSICWRRRSS